MPEISPVAFLLPYRWRIAVSIVALDGTGPDFSLVTINTHLTLLILMVMPAAHRLSEEKSSGAAVSDEIREIENDSWL